MWPYIPPYSPPCCIVKNYFALSPWGKSTKQQDANERKRIYTLSPCGLSAWQREGEGEGEG